jgi:hypothetical protein
MKGLIRYSLVLWAICALAENGFCQIKETSKSILKNTDAIIYNYSFTSEIEDTITVKIVDPRGELVKIAYRDQPIMTNESLDFSLNTSFWRQGKYQIVVESKQTGLITKGLTIRSNNLQKKSEE